MALIAKEMQMAWEKQGKPRHMDPVGRILRMLLLGGGGCGKTLHVVAKLGGGSLNMMNLRCGTAAQRARAYL